MTNEYTNFTLQEMMAVAAAREIKDGEKVIIGTGLPLLGAFLAQKTHAPNMVAIYESGAIDCKPLVTPFSVADSVLVPGSAMQGGLMEGLGIVHAGDLDVGFLGGAQIDKYGNLNTHVIGDYRKPKVRFAGSGGSNDIGAGCKRTIVMMLHQKQRFPEKVDFVTTPGYFGGGKEREKYGFFGNGPSASSPRWESCASTPTPGKCTWNPITPGHDRADQGKHGMGSQDCPDVHETERPDPELIRILREELDPTGVFLGKK